MTYYKQNRHKKKHFNSWHTTNRTDIKKKHFNSWHTTNRTDIKKTILIHDILQIEQTLIKKIKSRHTTNRTDIKENILIPQY